MIWAITYIKLGAVSSPEDAVLYSVDSMTKRGASGLFLARQWRVMGAAEAADGILLFGISTALLFDVIVGFWKERSSFAVRARRCRQRLYVTWSRHPVRYGIRSDLENVEKIQERYDAQPRVSRCATTT